MTTTVVGELGRDSCNVAINLTLRVSQWFDIICINSVIPTVFTDVYFWALTV